MPKYMIELPEDWRMGGDSCPLNCDCARTKCPLANAVKAVEITQADSFIVVTKGEEEGKPVKLWATEDK